MSANGFRSKSWWLLTVAGIRAVLSAAVLVTLYYVLPLDGIESDLSTVLKLAGGFIAFIALMTWQLRAITRADNPGLRAFEGLFMAIPLFLLLFAATYYIMSESDPSNFTAPLTRTDALYFTVTMFSTVGFGDITPRAQSARVLVMAQMILDLIILGAGVRIILNAVQRGRERQADEATPELAGS